MDRPVAVIHDSMAGSPAQGFASGGTCPGFAPFYAHPGEVMFSDREHYMATATQVSAMASQPAPNGGSGWAPGPVALTVMAGAGGMFEEMLAEMIRRYVQGSYGGSVQSAFGS